MNVLMFVRSCGYADNEILKPSKKVPEEGFLTSSRCKLHYKYLNQGIKGKNPLVLLHMAPRSMDEFKEFTEEMAKNREWKRYDESPASL